MFDLITIVKTIGYAGLFGLIFAETGLFIGAVLPGDSLLFTVGLLTSQGYFDLSAVLVIIFIAAIIGDITGYELGRRAGPRIFKKEDSLFFHKDNLIKTQAFFERYGGKTILVARFIPLIRSFTPLMAGVGRMRYRSFISYSVVGAIVWTGSVTMLGYYLGVTIPHAKDYLLIFVAIVILVTLGPTLWQIFKDPEVRARSLRELQQFWYRLRK
jgi:membrane-associated protein